jgi:hypothetical protein
MRRLLSAIFVIASAGGAARAAPPSPLPFQKRAFDARRSGDYRGCAAIFATAARQRTYDADPPFQAARCFSLLGRTDDAEHYLRLAFRRGFHECQRLQAAKELGGLRDAFAQQCTANDEAFLRHVNPALLFAFEDDQAERAALPPQPPWDFTKIARHDAARRHLVEVMLARGLVRSADDYYHAAMILQHGLDAGAYIDARRFARRAVELRPWFAEARWLYAAATDRYLQCMGKPQIFGTQYRQTAGQWTLEPFDPKAVSDAERMRWRVPSLLERMEFIDGLNAERR